jgi:exosome complex RNA-binding protein Csl4
MRYVQRLLACLMMGGSCLLFAQSAAPQGTTPDTPAAGQQQPRPDGEHRRMQMQAMGSERFIGPILEVAADHLVVLRPDSDAKVTVKPATDAHVVKDRNFGAKLTEFKVGDYAMVAGDMKDGVLEARLLASSEQQSQNLRENLGKTLILGKVVSVDLDAATVKVHRIDGQDQAVQADENSSFKRYSRSGPESITLADVKPGDNVSAHGALKNNVFTVTELTLMPPGAGPMGGMWGRGRGQQRPEGGAPPTNQPQQ